MTGNSLTVKSITAENAQIIERIERIQAEYGLSQRKFVERLGYNQRTYSEMLQRQSRVPAQLTAAIVREFGVSPRWLLTGEGNPRPDLPSVEPETPPGLVMLPLYGAKAAAGPARIALSEEPLKLLAFREDWIRSELRRNPADLFLLTVDGDSMFPTLVPGEVVLVDRTENLPNTDAIYLIRMGDGIMVKRLQWGIDKKLYIVSDNAAYKERQISQDDLSADGIAILGRVIWGGRRY